MVVPGGCDGSVLTKGSGLEHWITDESPVGDRCTEDGHLAKAAKAGLVVHSDRGSQYASKAYRRLLKAQGFVGSMSRKGNCWDTQFTILNEHRTDLTRAGIGELPLR